MNADKREWWQRPNRVLLIKLDIVAFANPHYVRCQDIK